MSYYTLLEALSFVGGIFNTFLALFFFMTLYGEKFIEFLFAQAYFNSKAARNYGFFSFLKQTLYRSLSLCGCKPRWKYVQQRELLEKTSKKMLCVVFLQKRVEFLEKAISVLLEPHHIKGLHLAHRRTRSEFDDSIKQFDFRDRLVGYFVKN